MRGAVTTTGLVDPGFIWVTVATRWACITEAFSNIWLVGSCCTWIMHTTTFWTHVTRLTFLIWGTLKCFSYCKQTKHQTFLKIISFSLFSMITIERNVSNKKSTRRCTQRLLGCQCFRLKQK